MFFGHTLNSHGQGYDDNGNISSTTDINGNMTTYTYDQLNQLVRADDQKAGVSTVYSYDIGGNITAFTTYAYTTGTPGTATDSIVYYYGNTNWKDLLTGYKQQNVIYNISYDTIGNPLAYRNGMSFTWEGRQLKSSIANSQDVEYTVDYTYDSNGIRTGKTINGVTTNYFLDGSVIMAQQTGNDILWFLYDSDRTLVGFTYNGTAYYYTKNVQGDVTGIVDSNVSLVVEYTYDAWGKLLSTTYENGYEDIAQANPFRYRGYYYDSETGLYCLNSRYYDPQFGRFLNADSVLNDDILGNNLFAYCGNNPVSRTDDSSQGWWILAGAVIGGVVGGVTKAITNVASGQEWNNGIIGAVVGGAVAGAIIAATGGAGAFSIIAAYSGATSESVVNQTLSYTSLAKVNGLQQVAVTKKNVVTSVKTVAVDTVVNGTVAAVTGNIAGKVVPTNAGWFTPQKFVSSFTGKYAVKVELQAVAQGSAQFVAESLMDSFMQRIKTGQSPVVTVFPGQEIISPRGGDSY